MEPTHVMESNKTVHVEAFLKSLRLAGTTEMIVRLSARLVVGRGTGLQAESCV